MSKSVPNENLIRARSPSREYQTHHHHDLRHVFRDAGYEVIQYRICRYFDEPPVGIMHESEMYVPNPPFTNIESGELEAFKA